MPLWRGPATGRVRIASPYRLRAGRFETLFVASLQDGEFPRHGGGSPFLSDEQRANLGLPEQARARGRGALSVLRLPLAADPAALPLATARATRRAPRRPRPRSSTRCGVLLDGEPLTRARSLGDVVFAVEQSASEDELARALAVSGADPGGLAVPPRWRSGSRARIARAGRGHLQACRPAQPPRPPRARRARRLRRHDPGGLRGLLLPLARRPRARPGCDRAEARPADRGVDPARRAPAPLRRAARRRPAAAPRVARRLALSRRRDPRRRLPRAGARRPPSGRPRDPARGSRG